jgi:hypothetical protein
VERDAQSPDGDRSVPADDDQRVDEMVEESFPASDPPAGWAGEDPRDRPDGSGPPGPAGAPGAGG